MSHEEIWDDSALIDSWNEALEEYKKYHSIHAKGGSLKEIQELSNGRNNARPEQSAADADMQGNTLNAGDETNAVGDADPTSRIPSNEHPGPPAPPTQAILGSLRDENLKKLIMSWYYAGYYTGLFEGQQQAQQPQT